MDQATILTMIALLYPPLVAIGAFLFRMNKKINDTYMHFDAASPVGQANGGRTMPAEVADHEIRITKLESVT